VPDLTLQAQGENLLGDTGREIANFQCGRTLFFGMRLGAGRQGRDETTVGHVGRGARRRGLQRRAGAGYHGGQVIVVINTVSNSLSLVDATSFRAAPW